MAEGMASGGASEGVPARGPGFRPGSRPPRAPLAPPVFTLRKHTGVRNFLQPLVATHTSPAAPVGGMAPAAAGGAGRRGAAAPPPARARALLFSSLLAGAPARAPARGRAGAGGGGLARAAEGEGEAGATPGGFVPLDQITMEEGEYQSESDRLRAAEKFMVKGDGAAECSSCGYKYTPENGDPDYPVAYGTLFADLPGDWACPICGAPPAKFKESGVVVAGFAENQGYGFGGNELTGESKLLLIYGALAFFVALFLGGYLLD